MYLSIINLNVNGLNAPPKRHRRTPKIPPRKFLEVINEFSKVAGYKINIQKSVAFLYANNELTQREIKKPMPFTIATKRIKYLE